MKTNRYDLTRLAVLYFPDSTEKNARRRLFKLLQGERDLWKQLTTLHFGRYQRTLTPRQYEAITHTLGLPDSDDDFGNWAR